VTGGATVGALGVRRSAETLAYLEPGAAPAPGPLPFNAGEHLDIARARRLDRAGRLATVAIAGALRDAGITDVDADATERGAIVGSAFGSVDGSTAYMRRIYDKGPKFASPADFPNLVPSSPVGHASIYLGLRGPVLAVADLGATAECAVATAAELIESGEGDLLAAGSVEETSELIERCLSPVCSGIDERGVRSEGASVLVLEASERAEHRGARVLAELRFWTSWRGDAAAPLAALPAPPEGALVLVGREDDAITCALAGSAWAEVPRKPLAPRTGDHEGAGGFAMTAAVGTIDTRLARAVLVVGTAPARGYALLFVGARAEEGATRA
jgi:3-oxoacyl-[acyl-carrier-protein] synthase II